MFGSEADELLEQPIAPVASSRGGQRPGRPASSERQRRHRCESLSLSLSPMRDGVALGGPGRAPRARGRMARRTSDGETPRGDARSPDRHARAHAHARTLSAALFPGQKITHQTSQQLNSIGKCH